MSANTRGVARAMVRASNTAPASSIIGTSAVLSRLMLRSALSSSASSSCNVTGLCTFGTNSPNAPALQAASASRRIMSRSALIRTNTFAPFWPTRLTVSGSFARAGAFSERATASSRSRMIASAPRSCALAMKRSALAGT
jgi:hypothetical protein